MLTGRRIHIFFILLLIGMRSSIASNQKDNGECCVLTDSYGVIMKVLPDSNIIYKTIQGEEYVIRLNGLHGKNGESAIKEAIYDNIAEDYECNIREVFVILFDSKLKIEEIRIADIGKDVDTPGCKHRKSYTKAIQQTEGMWINTGQEQEKYVYILSLHIH